MELDKFESWITQKVKQNHASVSVFTIKYRWRKRKIKPALEVVLETYSDKMGDIIFWESGEAELRIFDKVSEINPSKYIIANSVEELETAFNDFFNNLFS